MALIDRGDVKYDTKQENISFDSTYDFKVIVYSNVNITFKKPLDFADYYFP